MENSNELCLENMFSKEQRNATIYSDIDADSQFTRSRWKWLQFLSKYISFPFAMPALTVRAGIASENQIASTFSQLRVGCESVFIVVVEACLCPNILTLLR